jgi:hypothetical protein
VLSFFTKDSLLHLLPKAGKGFCLSRDPSIRVGAGELIVSLSQAFPYRQLLRAAFFALTAINAVLSCRIEMGILFPGLWFIPTHAFFAIQKLHDGWDRNPGGAGQTVFAALAVAAAQLVSEVYSRYG